MVGINVKSGDKSCLLVYFPNKAEEEGRIMGHLHKHDRLQIDCSLFTVLLKSFPRKMKPRCSEVSMLSRQSKFPRISRIPSLLQSQDICTGSKLRIHGLFENLHASASKSRHQLQRPGETNLLGVFSEFHVEAYAHCK